MPEQAGNLDAVGEMFGIRLPEFAARPPEVTDNNAATKDMQRVQSGEREVKCKLRVVPGAVVWHVLGLGTRNCNFPGLDLLLRTQIIQILFVRNVAAFNRDGVRVTVPQVTVSDAPVSQLNFVMDPFI